MSKVEVELGPIMDALEKALRPHAIPHPETAAGSRSNVQMKVNKGFSDQNDKNYGLLLVRFMTRDLMLIEIIFNCGSFLRSPALYMENMKRDLRDQLEAAKKQKQNVERIVTSSRFQ